MIIQFCGMSGSGKTTIAYGVKDALSKEGVKVEVIDGDEYRTALCSDLGFSKLDRNRNIRRLAFVASKLSKYGIVTIICAINPYDELRLEIARSYPNVRTVFVNCDIDTLIERDTKGLYKRALLPESHPDKISNLTGVNDPFEIPEEPDLMINTANEVIEVSTNRLAAFIRHSMVNAPLV